MLAVLAVFAYFVVSDSQVAACKKFLRCRTGGMVGQCHQSFAGEVGWGRCVGWGLGDSGSGIAALNPLANGLWLIFI